MKQKSVIILGATGNIGLAALDIISRYPHLFKVKTVVTDGNNIRKLAQLASKHKIEKIAIKNVNKFHELNLELRDIGSYCEVFAGQSAISDCITEGHDICISAIPGMPGIIPTISSVPYVKTLILANKESITCAGEILLEEVKKNGVTLIPVNLAHNGIFQTLSDDKGRTDSSKVRNIKLTVSRNPGYKCITLKNRHESLGEFIKDVKSELDISMLQKSIEIIEVARLFNVDVKNIDILIQGKPMVHSLVEFKNGSQVLNISRPNLNVSLGYALSWPHNVIENEPILFDTVSDISFDVPKINEFPITDLAKESYNRGTKGIITFNTASEIVLSSLMSNRIELKNVTKAIEEVMSSCHNEKSGKVSNILDIMSQYDVTVGKAKNALKKYYL